MDIKLTPKHNEAAGNLINLFVKYAEKGEINPDVGYLAAMLGIVAGREALKNSLGEKYAEYQYGDKVNAPDIDKTAEELVGFLFWTGEVLKFKPFKKGENQLTADDAASLMRFVNQHSDEFLKAYEVADFPVAERPYIALLAVTNAVEFFGNDKEPFTFSVASTLALNGMVFATRNIS